MEMMIVMFSPLWALVLFIFQPFWTALSLYIPIFLFGALINIKMMTSMKLPVRTGREEMVGKEALVVDDINPEGKVQINGEFWAATTGGRPAIFKGETAKIVGVEGLVLIMEDAGGQVKRSKPEPLGHLTNQPEEVSHHGY
jgi:membrane-bound ClpP family serine protease